MIPFLEILLALPFVLALVVALARGLPRGATAWLAGLAPLLGLVVLAWLTPSVLQGWNLRAEHAWLPQIGLDFTLRLDGLAWMFAGLVLAIGALVVIYARYYLSEKDSAPRFFASLLLFMGSMLVSSQNTTSNNRLPASTTPSIEPMKSSRLAKKRGALSFSLR